MTSKWPTPGRQQLPHLTRAWFWGRPRLLVPGAALLSEESPENPARRGSSLANTDPTVPSQPWKPFAYLSVYTVNTGGARSVSSWFPECPRQVQNSYPLCVHQ